MPEMSSSRRQFHNRIRSLWQFVLLLAILAAMTVTLVVTCFGQFINQNDSSFKFKVTDDESVWSQDTPVELFHTSYKNNTGEITVLSAGSDSVVAPGTGGDYTFSLKNACQLNSNYQVWLEADANISSSAIPIEFRMSGSNGWVDGNGEWLSAEDLNQLTERRNLYAGKSTEYTLYWRWAFDRDEDTEDTSYGNYMTTGQNGTSTGSANVSQSVSYVVTLHTVAKEGLISENTDSDSTDTKANTDRKTDDTKAADETGYNESGTAVQNKAATHSSGTISKKASRTGDTTPVFGWIMVLILAGVAILATVIYRKREHIRKGR